MCSLVNTRRSGSSSTFLCLCLTVLGVLIGCTDASEVGSAPTPTTTAESVRSTTPNTDLESTRTSASPDISTTPTLVWQACGPSFECADLSVPLDHDEPTGSTLSLALVRVPAQSTEPRGSIVVNPGGPGGSGIAFVERGFRFDDETMDNYHLVGFDPRGIGASSPLTCAIDRTAGPLVDFAPDSDEEAVQLDRDAQRLARQCQEADGERLAHQSTTDSARDLELVRQSLGDEMLNFVGFSYGTHLGLTYAQLFPDRVGHLVLDGVVDPAQGLSGLLRQQAIGFDRSFDRLVAACAPSPTAPATCPDGGVEAAYDDLLQRLEVEVDAGLGPTEFVLATLAALYDEDSFGGYLDALLQGLRGDTGALEAISDRFASAADVAAYLSVLCVDSVFPRGGEAWDALADDLADRSSRFGPTIANEVRACAHWTVDPDSAAELGVLVEDPLTQAPILVIGATGDPATPLANAQAVSASLANGRLVIVEAAEHTSYRPGGCVGRLVQEYLNRDILPETVVRCSQN